MNRQVKMLLKTVTVSIMIVFFTICVAGCGDKEPSNEDSEITELTVTKDIKNYSLADVITFSAPKGYTAEDYYQEKIVKDGDNSIDASISFMKSGEENRLIALFVGKENGNDGLLKQEYEKAVKNHSGEMETDFGTFYYIINDKTIHDEKDPDAIMSEQGITGYAKIKDKIFYANFFVTKQSKAGEEVAMEVPKEDEEFFLDYIKSIQPKSN